MSDDNGNVYEKKNIIAYIKQHSKCPKSNRPLAVSELMPHVILREEIVQEVSKRRMEREQHDAAQLGWGGKVGKGKGGNSGSGRNTPDSTYSTSTHGLLKSKQQLKQSNKDTVTPITSHCTGTGTINNFGSVGSEGSMGATGASSTGSNSSTGNSQSRTNTSSVHSSVQTFGIGSPVFSSPPSHLRAAAPLAPVTSPYRYKAVDISKVSGNLSDNIGTSVSSAGAGGSGGSSGGGGSENGSVSGRRKKVKKAIGKKASQSQYLPPVGAHNTPLRQGQRQVDGTGIGPGTGYGLRQGQRQVDGEHSPLLRSSTSISTGIRISTGIEEDDDEEDDDDGSLVSYEEVDVHDSQLAYNPLSAFLVAFWTFFHADIATDSDSGAVGGSVGGGFGIGRYWGLRDNLYYIFVGHDHTVFHSLWGCFQYFSALYLGLTGKNKTRGSGHSGHDSAESLSLSQSKSESESQRDNENANEPTDQDIFSRSYKNMPSPFTYEEPQQAPDYALSATVEYNNDPYSQQRVTSTFIRGRVKHVQDKHREMDLLIRVSICLTLNFTILSASCLMWSGALDSSDLLLSYP